MNPPLSHIRTQQILIGREHPAYRGAAYCTQIARRIKNATHYLIRHHTKPNGKKMGHSDADKWLKKHNTELYNKLPSALAQRSTQIAGQEWASFYEALKAYRTNPSAFRAAPRPPRYANKAATLHIGRNGFCVRKGVIHFAQKALPPVKTGFEFSQKWNASITDTIALEVRIVPRGSCFVAEVIYDSTALEAEGNYCRLLDTSRTLGIDLGIDTLMALAANQPDIRPVLIAGKALKSLNAWYNQRVAQLRSLNKYAHIPAVTALRNRQMKDALHRAVRSGLFA